MKKDKPHDLSCQFADIRNRFSYVTGSVQLMTFVFIFMLLPGMFCPLWANVFNSAHDLYNQGYLMIQESQARSSAQCAVCHPVHGRDRPRIWDMLPDSLNGYGTAGNICASCHDGVSIVDRNVDASLTVFHPESHGNDMGEAPARTVTKNTGLPSDDLKCDNCHDPHNEVNRPFMRIPIKGLCSKCHKERGYAGVGINNSEGNHPVGVEPFDDSGGPSPIEIDSSFAIPFPDPYPGRDGMLSKRGHWTLGGRLSFGHFGKIECTTCHSFHGLEGTGPVEALLSRDPVNRTANEFCEGCHRGERGDDNPQPPYPNPGGTTTGRTYHPVDDDEANGAGWNVAIADTVELQAYQWGQEDPDTELPTMLCTTCHVAHNGMDNSPALIDITEEIMNEGVDTFCEICHRKPPEGHHGYEEDGVIDPDIAEQMNSNMEDLGVTYGQPSYDRIYCSHCHRAHNAGFDQREEYFIPILVDQITNLCDICHSMGVSHFLGDPTLPSTFGVDDPPLYRDPWPATGLKSLYIGDGEIPNTVTCLSCHYLSSLPEGIENAGNHRLLAPADENTEWTDGYSEDYLCTGCHGVDPSTENEGHSHPMMDADTLNFPNIYTNHLSTDEIPVTYTEGDKINCHSCHKTHHAVERGGVYILKVVSGENFDPKAIHPKIDFTKLCHSCHPSEEY